jgi:hypothetical protein
LNLWNRTEVGENSLCTSIRSSAPGMPRGIAGVTALQTDSEKLDQAQRGL